MKKIFTLFFALLAIAFSVKAQVPVFSENFDAGMPAGWTQIDANNDAMGWEHSSNPASYFVAGTDLSGSGHNSSTGFVLSGSYSNVTSQAITPDNWLISPAITLTSNSDLSFYVCAQDASYASEHYGVYITTGSGTTTSEFTLLFEETLDANGGSRVQGAWGHKTYSLASYTGQTVRIAFRHFNCNNEFVLNLDDVEVLTQPTDPTIIATPTAVDFGTALLGNTNNATVAVTAYNLTAGVTATTSAPFAVSADGTTYGTTATVAAAGGTLYLQYTPTAVGTDNGTLTLSSTGATNVTIPLTGAAIECNGTIPYSYDFSDATANLCWTVVNANNDDYTFEFNTDGGYASIRYNSSLAMDDWLISPVFALTGGQTGSVDYRSGSSSWFEKLQIFAIGATDTVALTPVIEAHNTTFETVYFDLSSLTGNYQLAIHGISDADQLRLYVTNVNIYNGAPTASLTLSADTLDFGTIPAGSTSTVKTVLMSTVNVNEAFTLTTSAPFEISLDGTNFAATQTIPANSALVVDDSIYVRFVPTAAGTFSQNIAIGSASQNATIALSGVAADCANESITTFPYLNDFNTGFPVCWGYNDPDNFFVANVDEDGTDKAVGFQNLDMLVTPEITSNSPMAVMFGYRGYLGDNLEGMDPTTFRVGYSSTNSDVASFTWLETVNVNQYPADGSVFFNYVNSIPANAKYVAIDVTYLATLATLFGDYDDVIYIDNFQLITDGDIFVNPESMNFGNAIAGTATSPKTATVTAALLTSTISVTAPANFEVSANGGSYAATATIPQAGGTLYVRYNPAAPGNHSGNITLTSGSITKSIAVSGTAVDCSQPHTLPFTENFENGMPSCWSILDQDGDGYTWEHSFEPVSYYSNIDLSGSGNNGSDGFVMSGSYSNVNGALTPDNWLITPALVIPSNGAKLTWYVSAVDADYAEEYYEVMLSTSLTPNSFTSVFNETLQSDEWEQRSVNISGNYAGQNVYVAFRNYNTNDIFLMKIDDISVTPGTGVENHETTTSIYPNPANNVLNITSNENINRVEVFNMMGQMVGAYEANDVNTQINTSSFANGVYTVKIATENGTSTKKFTVAR